MLISFGVTGFGCYDDSIPHFSQINEISVAPSTNTGEQYASTTFKATIRYANKFSGDALIKLFIKLVVPKQNAFSDENSFDTGNSKW